jgi:hypothetical protein
MGSRRYNSVLVTSHRRRYENEVGESQSISTVAPRHAFRQALKLHMYDFNPKVRELLLAVERRCFTQSLCMFPVNVINIPLLCPEMFKMFNKANLHEVKCFKRTHFISKIKQHLLLLQNRAPDLAICLEFQFPPQRLHKASPLEGTVD